jgi:hypothetical protein
LAEHELDLSLRDRKLSQVQANNIDQKIYLRMSIFFFSLERLISAFKMKSRKNYVYHYIDLVLKILSNHNLNEK